MKLIEGYKDRFYVIDKIEGDLFLKNKLKRMSLEVGSVVQIISKYPRCPFLVEVNHNRIAFSQSLAKKIEVIPYV